MTGRTAATPADYRPLQPVTLLVQLVVLFGVEVFLYQTYAARDSSFHWAVHFLVGVIAAAAYLAGHLAITDRPARGQLAVVLACHLFAMGPDLLFRAGIPHRPWMEVFLAHISVHYLPGGDRTWLVLAVLAVFGYALALSHWLRVRHAQAGM